MRVVSGVLQGYITVYKGFVLGFRAQGLGLGVALFS